MTGWRFPLTCLAGASLFSCGSVPEEAHAVGFGLPQQLNEISGLAEAGPDSVFAHNDEYAIVFEIHLGNGRVLRAFALGEPTIEGDFEGIAAVGGKVFLVTSDGLIYAARPGDNAERVDYTVHDTGIGSRCEVEGLTVAPEPGELLILCKRLRNGSKSKVRLELYRWTIGGEHAADEPWLSLNLKGLLKKDERAEFRPSAVEWDAADQRLLVVSARNRLMLVLDRDGQLLERRKLSGSSHPKTEGIAIMSDGRMVLADEGNQTREGRLAVYPKFLVLQ